MHFLMPSFAQRLKSSFVIGFYGAAGYYVFHYLYAGYVEWEKLVGAYIAAGLTEFFIFPQREQKRIDLENKKLAEREIQVGRLR